jgi:NTP pyrophosphatase (non-canonical NTP hydrolase)
MTQHTASDRLAYTDHDDDRNPMTDHTIPAEAAAIAVLATGDDAVTATRITGTPISRRALTIRGMQDSAYSQSVTSGFWDDYGTMHQHIRDTAGGPTRDLMLDQHIRTTIAEKLALIHSETSEALEDVRAGRDIDSNTYRADGKPEGLPSELADIIIRIGDLAGWLGIDLEAAVIEKMQFNASRPYKHGKQL